MAWTDVANNQTISNENLKNAIDTGVFSAGGTSIPLTAPDNKKQGTKGRIATYINVPNPNFPSYDLKESNQLLTRGDIYSTGTFRLDTLVGSGKSFTNISGTDLPVNGNISVTGVADYTLVKKIPAQNFTITITGPWNLTGQTARISLLIDSNLINTQTISQSNVTETKTINIPFDVYPPSTIRVSIQSGTAPSTTTISSFNFPINNVAISKTSGQYQFATGGLTQVSTSVYYPYPYQNGYLYRSTDYGVTWTRITTFYNLWKKIACSNDGQYVMAIPHYGYPARSTDYGATWASITEKGQKYWSGVAMSDNGSRVTLTAFDTISSVNGTGTAIYRSTDYGATFGASVTYGNTSWAFSSVAMDPTGQYQVASKLYARMYYSSDYGANWSNSIINETAYFTDLIRNDSGTNNTTVAAYMFASGNGYSSGTLQSTNYGSSWSVADTTAQGIIFSQAANSGGTQYAVMYNNTTSRNIKYRTNGNFLDLTAAGSYNWWQCVAVGGGQTYMLAGHSSGLRRSSDSGATWNSL